MQILDFQESDYENYENFLENHNAELYQSLPWVKFQQNSPNNRQFWILVAQNKQKWLGTILLIKYRLPFGRSWFSVARGPIITNNSLEDQAQIWGLFLEKIRVIAKKEKAIFLRLELPINSHLKLSGKGWRKAHAHYFPEWSIKIDLTLSEENLLKQMKSKGRYNIKIAQKAVEIRVTAKEKDIHDFYEILKQTGGRDGFSIHEEAYYQALIHAANQDNWGEFLVAEYQGKIIGGIMVTFYSDTATYYYGASDYENRSLMAPYLLQWNAILAAKKRGLKKYDLLGIAPPDEPNHPWQGITRFKEKFGGEIVNYPLAKELIFRPIEYYYFRLLKWIRGSTRRLFSRKA
ncbi:MAG: hypothetical protein UT55_C0036G0006 [Candidatus Peregrinibacteria bacterium GW2011_GWE2_39_6]|nr:MAG: hypothetical protein UT36_C0011G0032 [Candidatus Peregrinibacteria bacterium GW2011_GWF2_39_17]KKR25616.1 MAG: hypothetical protein UT55_C0036G0006 [Candidatus Peregrinibacteria bacterium GW2011_GWE2_39_6]HCW32509.1 hypothetical protein [Candidatus Peregrinibacteria bacterium]